MIWQRGFTKYCTELPNMKEFCYRMKIKMICCCLNEAVISITTNCKLKHFLCVVLRNIHTLPIHVCSKLTKLEFTRGGRRTEVGSNQSTSLGREGEHIAVHSQIKTKSHIQQITFQNSRSVGSHKIGFNVSLSVCTKIIYIERFLTHACI